MSGLYPLVVVHSHEVLIPSQPLLRNCSDFIQQVQVDAQFFVVAFLVVVIHSEASEPYHCWYHRVSAKRKLE